MLKKSLVALALVAGIALAAAALSQSGASADTDAPAANEQPVAEEKVAAPVKEFTMTSFYEMVDGKPKPQFSVTELTVKRGDFVRIKITNTKGNHDFNIDELGVRAATPLDTEVVVEFSADKAGEFVYYCSTPGHRANGHWGTLTVLE